MNRISSIGRSMAIGFGLTAIIGSVGSLIITWIDAERLSDKSFFDGFNSNFQAASKSYLLFALFLVLSVCFFIFHQSKKDTYQQSKFSKIFGIVFFVYASLLILAYSSGFVVGLLTTQ